MKRKWSEKSQNRNFEKLFDYEIEPFVKLKYRRTEMKNREIEKVKNRHIEKSSQKSKSRRSEILKNPKTEISKNWESEKLRNQKS